MKTKNAGLRDRLKAIKSDQDTARDERATAVKERDAAKKAFEDADIEPKAITESAEFKAAEEAVRAVGELDDQLADLSVAEKGILAMLGEDIPAPSDGNGPRDAAAARPVGGWDIQGITQGDRYKELVKSGQLTSQSQLGSIHLGQLASREQAATLLRTGPQAGPLQAADVGSDNKLGAIPADRRGIIQPNLKALTLLDLIPVGTTDSNLVEYVQVTGIPSSAAETAEGDLKPEESFTTVDADAPVRTIAGWIKVRKQALADVAGLQTLIGQLLPYDVRRRIESQILVGNGVGQNLKGILNTTGVGAPPAVVGDNTADAILRAVTVIFLSDGDPNFVALHPLTWQQLLLMREDQANRKGAYLYGTPASPAAPTIWGLAITNNRVVPANSPLVGDAMGATLLVREGVNVRVSDSDGDDFRRNRVTVLAEARVALPIWRPSSFAVAAVPGQGS